jgi:Fic family protein
LKYKATDSKGRYLYWDKFKWHVKDDDPKKAWFATKWERMRNQKNIELLDKNGDAFVFCIPDTLEAKLFQISNLSGQGIVPHNSIKNRYLISSLVMEEAISSSQLEGASTTRKVAKEILVSNRKPNTVDEEMIVNNYLLMKALKRVKSEELSIDMILEFHRIATRNLDSNGNIEGTFCQSDDIVITDGVEENILHQPPPFKSLTKRLQKLCDFANKEHGGEEGEIFINPIIKAVILHFMIGYEHPFSDGNGRTARAIFYWYMLKNGFDYFEYVSISKLLKEAPKQYAMSYIYTEIDDNDLTYFIYYQMDIIIRAIDELLEYLKVKGEEFEEITAILSTSELSDSLNFIQKDIIQKSMKNPGRVFVVKEIASDYDISENSARKYLNELTQFKMLAQYKDGKSFSYVALENLYMLLTVK